ncbi:MAG: hypothetical protein K0R90_474 [Oscillospiraceae bacterium]|jgi:membrane protein YdbS with pleckstrin-like domain|nr:hypothetical protein [Oscillospiraceae bacterium]
MIYKSHKNPKGKILIMEFKRISKKALLIWELAVISLWLVVLVLSLYFIPPFIWLWHLVVWPLAASMIFVVFVYIPWLYSSMKYAVTKDMIVYEKGVFFHKQYYMRRDRIVFVTVFKTPLTPIFKTTSLIISATGSKIVIPLMDNKESEQLAALISPNTDLS